MDDNSLTLCAPHLSQVKVTMRVRRGEAPRPFWPDQKGSASAHAAGSGPSSKLPWGEMDLARDGARHPWRMVDL